MTYNVLRAPTPGAAISAADIAKVQEHLNSDGWALLRGFDVDMGSFSALTANLCRKIGKWQHPGLSGHRDVLCRARGL